MKILINNLFILAYLSFLNINLFSQNKLNFKDFDNDLYKISIYNNIKGLNDSQLISVKSKRFDFSKLLPIDEDKTDTTNYYISYYDTLNRIVKLIRFDENEFKNLEYFFLYRFKTIIYTCFITDLSHSFVKNQPNGFFINDNGDNFFIGMHNKEYNDFIKSGRLDRISCIMFLRQDLFPTVALKKSDNLFYGAFYFYDSLNTNILLNEIIAFYKFDFKKFETKNYKKIFQILKKINYMSVNDKKLGVNIYGFNAMVFPNVFDKEIPLWMYYPYKYRID